MADTDDTKTEQEVEPQVETTEETIDDGVAELQRKLEEAERARVAAERQRDEAFRRAGQAETSAFGSNMAVLQGALDTLNANRETLKKEFAAALANGEFDRVSEIQARIADEAAQRLEVEKGKAAMEAQRGAPQPTGGGDPRVERYVSNLQPRAASWIRTHPQYVTDQRLNDELMEKHFAARRAGHEEGSDDYFDFVEGGLGLKRGAEATPARQAAANGAAAEEPTSAAAKAVQTRDVQPSPAAPSRGGGTRQIRLSTREQEAARISGLTDEEYAKNMERERKAGTIGKDRVH